MHGSQALTPNLTQSTLTLTLTLTRTLTSLTSLTLTLTLTVALTLALHPYLLTLALCTHPTHEGTCAQQLPYVMGVVLLQGCSMTSVWHQYGRSTPAGAQYDICMAPVWA